jgi:hypothetical protein
VILLMFLLEVRDGGEIASRVESFSPGTVFLAATLVDSRAMPALDGGLLPEASTRIGEVAVLTGIGGAATTVCSKATAWIGSSSAGMMKHEGESPSERC